MATEADTCRKYVLPKLYTSGWNDDQICEQRTITDGRILVVGDTCKRKKQKRVDYLLRLRRDFALAVVEAKAEYKKAGDGIQQAKDYAETLGLKFAYATNGHGIIEHDYTTGHEQELSTFPSPDELWQRLRKSEHIENEDTAQKLLTPYFHNPGKEPRYYQQIAINRVVQHILQGKPRILITMATGTGKTVVAFQIAWKLWNCRWNRTNEHRRPRILFLSDRSVLVDDPKDKDFVPFADARHKIEGEVIKSREMYFALYQSIAKDENRPGLYKEYGPDFFDLIIIDECHRGSARDDSNWREILEYFEPSYQLGMTATPLREDNRDTYKYFGNPIYTYSLKQGIEDGFLAPYRVHRIIPDIDAAGWRPGKEELDRYGREIPDGEYGTKDFETIISFKRRTEAVAKHLTNFLKKTNRFAKTIVFCVDQEHAEDMRRALSNLNSDLVKQYPDYVCRVVSEEGTIGRGHLSRFQEIETQTPVILTTSRLLTTGIDAPMCKNIVIFRVVNSMTEFKQIIGRGTRVRDDYGKLFFNILDYTGSATRNFADPAFDGEPALITEEEIDQDGTVKPATEEIIKGEDLAEFAGEETKAEYTDDIDDPDKLPRKFYVDNVTVAIATQLVYELDPNGKKLRVIKFTDYTREQVTSMFASSAELRSKWSKRVEREAVIAALEDRGIAFESLIEATGQAEADPFDLLCHVAFNAPLRTRRERAERLKKDQKNFFDHYAGEARAILLEVLDKYIEHGTAQFKVPDILKVEPVSNHGNVIEITTLFGGPEKLRDALSNMQNLLYAA